jgi:5-methylcytosine-specific restriction endonuclease McrA
MRLLKELPELEEKIESGALSLSVISQAQRFFRQEAKVEKRLATQEKRELLTVLEGKSSREAEKELLKRSSEPVALRPESVRPVSETHSEVKFLATQETLEQLERIRGLLGHVHSELSMGELITIMAKMTLEKLDPAREPKRRQSNQVSQVVSTQKPSETGERRYIQAALRRDIWKRAKGRCAGCGSFRRLQIDHVTPIAKGGTNAPENLRLLCFHCNQRQADLALGRDAMERYRHKQTTL